MKLPPLGLVGRFVALALLSGAGVAAEMEGVFVLDRGKEKSPVLLEITEDSEAYLWRQRKLSRGTVTAHDGSVQLDFPKASANGGPLELTLSPDAGDWIDQNHDRWIPRERLLKPDPSWTPVRIEVKGESGEAIGKFGYRYHIEGAGEDWDPLLVRPLQAEAGKIELSAPADCVIHLQLEHPDLVGGYGSYPELERKDSQAELVAEVQVGRTVNGKIIDDATGKPVAGAMVSPLIFTPPGTSPDPDKQTVTDQQGGFELRGVGKFGFVVVHPDFVKEEVYLFDEKIANPLETRLRAGETIRGTVHDPQGRPLAGVEVEDGTGKSALTDETGHFVLRGLRKWSGGNWWLDFSKEGFNEHEFRAPEVGDEGVKITLQPLPDLRGQVLRTDGTPVRKFRVICGPGATPDEFRCVTADIDDADGRFAIQPERLPKEGSDYWFGIRADDLAPWDGVISLADLSHGNHRIVLFSGFSLSAEIVVPESAVGQLTVDLEPLDRLPPDSFLNSPHPGKPLASRQLELKIGEPLRIARLRPGHYQLKIHAMGATPDLRMVTLAGDDLDLGKIQLAGTGTIFGVANDPYDPRIPWRFADGEIHVEGFGKSPFDEFMKFKTDTKGRFRVDGVPAGTVTVSFPYNLSADMISAITREVRVSEGMDTEVRAEGIVGAWVQPLKLLFDGQEQIPAYAGTREVDNVTNRGPMFRVEVTSPGTGPVSGPVTTECSPGDPFGPAIPDLSPGTWRIRAYDWLGSRGFGEGWRAETTVTVGERREPVTLEFGGKSLDGRVTSERETRRHVLVIAVGKTSGRVFYSRCDGDGDFVIRYLPEDHYLVHAHDDDGGWCDLGTHHLDQAAVDCGVHGLATGGHATGRLGHLGSTSRKHTRLVALGSGGVKIPVDELAEDGTYRFGNLKPGTWTILLYQGEQEIGRQPVEIKEGQSTRVPELEGTLR